MAEGYKMNQRGFTLLELLVCLVIFSVGLLSVSAMQIVSMKNNLFAANVAQATLLAKADLEYLRDLPLSSAELSIGSQVRAVPGTDFSLSRVVSDNSGNLMLTVTVQWTDQAVRNVTLRTLRLKT